MHYASLERGLIAFTGPDAQTFLHNLLSCDVAGLPADHSTYGSFCTPKGRMLAIFLLWRTQDGFLMVLPATLCEPIRKRLAMYILRLKVKAVDATGQYAVFGIGGKESAAFVDKLAGRPLTTLHDVAYTPHGMVLRLPGDRYEIITSREQAESMRLTLAANAQAATEEWWNALAIRAGIPCVLSPTQEQFVPQAMNLDAIGGVSFTKGCYPGQEIVARMHYLGRLKERMYIAHIANDEAPRPGDKIFGVDVGNQAAGMIVNAAPATSGGHDVLAVTRLSSVAAGPVRWKSADGPPLEILPLPYLLPAT
jgi:tRNA-modifying protein YgfZ